MLKSKSEDVVMHLVVDDIYIITTCQMVSYHPLWIHSQRNSKQFLTAVDTTLHVPFMLTLQFLQGHFTGALQLLQGPGWWLCSLPAVNWGLQ
jgi:hypothetical protein